MSYTTMYAVPESGEIYEVADFKNAFRSAFLAWDQLSQRYLGKGVALKMASGKGMQEVWDISKNQQVSIAHRVVMMMTFDKVMVKRENFERLASAIDEYARMFDAGTLTEQASKIRELLQDETVFAVCWNQTSVSYPVWCIDTDNDEGRMYDLSRDSDHWFLFDKLIT